MGHRYLQIATSPAAREAQTAYGSRRAYAEVEADGPPNDRLGPAETAFIAARDSLYMASVNPAGWPYIQHRGGPPGFLRAVDDRRLAFADLRGNRQYLTLGNVATDDRVALFLMDYPHRRRLKLLGRMRAVRPAELPPLPETVNPARVERGFVIEVEAFDWNCPQHITPRFAEAELAEILDPIRRRAADLEAENAALRARLAELDQESPR